MKSLSNYLCAKYIFIKSLMTFTFRHFARNIVKHKPKFMNFGSETQKSLIFTRSEHFNLNSSSDAKYWGGQFNKYISFDGCYRIRSDDISSNFPPFDISGCDSLCSYNPFSLVDTVIGEFKIGSCISALCWHPCNKLLIEKQLEK